MLFRYLKDVLSRQDNSKTNLKCLEDVLRRLGNAYCFTMTTLARYFVNHCFPFHTIMNTQLYYKVHNSLK